jgi:hypothetical protein
MNSSIIFCIGANCKTPACGKNDDFEPFFRPLAAQSLSPATYSKRVGGGDKEKKWLKRVFLPRAGVLQLALGFVCCIFFSSCTFQQSDSSLITQLQVREMQTRDIDTSDMKLVIKSMMNVLQDEGFIIKNVVPEAGLLCAEKNVDTENIALAILSSSMNRNARWEKQQIREASANISEFGTKTRIRINFQNKILDNEGQLRGVKSVTDPKVYQDFFEKVSKGIFIQEQNI